MKEVVLYVVSVLPVIVAAVLAWVLMRPGNDRWPRPPTKG